MTIGCPKVHPKVKNPKTPLSRQRNRILRNLIVSVVWRATCCYHPYLIWLDFALRCIEGVLTSTSRLHQDGWFHLRVRLAIARHCLAKCSHRWCTPQFYDLFGRVHLGSFCSLPLTSILSLASLVVSVLLFRSLSCWSCEILKRFQNPILPLCF